MADHATTSRATPPSPAVAGALPRLVAFDLDDTLAPSKAPLPAVTAGLLCQVLRSADVAVISGGAFTQFRTQVVDQLVDADDAELERVHLLPTCGTQYYRYRERRWEQVYAEGLDPEQRRTVLEVLEREARKLGLWPLDPWGPVVEDRGSQVTFSALGQHAPVEAKSVWDRDGAKKEALRAAVAPLLPDLEVRSGGSTSVDVTRRGIDKAYGIRRLLAFTGLRPQDVVFVGDRLDRGGNDWPVLSTGVTCLPVTGWADTVALLEHWVDAARTA
ncbi:hypothetical protein KDY119_00963 [Luteimicrobium xylanilyticum]|uniref:phosphomannomutase n=1 Tax=Luteimicrobium xylanilyticum TaxID=1133546 RepID=A0A5P9QAK7_9MICO|nr:HAD-IIB family hydrolase [Luteimicrobium xylanilyticum]QFU97465.1 hypothetical protein KDY119_00963 [Luteimicrobium xylanilyticum]